VFWLALRFLKAAHFASVSGERGRSIAVGVGQVDPVISITFREKSLLPASLFPFCAGVPAIGVGHDEQPLAEVAGPGAAR